MHINENKRCGELFRVLLQKLKTENLNLCDFVRIIGAVGCMRLCVFLFSWLRNCSAQLNVEIVNRKNRNAEKHVVRL